MGSTELTTRGTNEKRLTDKERRFCQEYLVDYRGKRAAVAAGYSEGCAAATAYKLLKKPTVAAFIGKAENKRLEGLEIKREEVLAQLLYCATRTGTDFVDEDGRIIENIHELPRRAQNAIDGIKQKRRVRQLKDGTTEVEIESELKLVSKASAIDMAMRHKSLYAPQEIETTGKMDIQLLTHILDNIDDTRVIDGDYEETPQGNSDANPQ